MNRCLYCYDEVPEGLDYHEKCSRAFFGFKAPPAIPYSLTDMSELAKQVVERSVSVPGVQAKLSMGIVRRTLESAESRLTVVGALGGNYILKPPSDRFPELPENEHVTMRIAEAFSIAVVPTSLVRLKSGEFAFITRRVDRGKGDAKIHMLDMLQIIEASEKYRSSMEKIGKALTAYSSNPLLDKLFLFERTVFCFLTCNNDMHLKNFSMIKAAAGWVLSPAYDLLNVALALPTDNEELALTLEGKRRKFKRNHFESFGKGLGLTDRQIRTVFTRFEQLKPKAIDWIQRSFLSPQSKSGYIQLLEDRYQSLQETSSDDD